MQATNLLGSSTAQMTVIVTPASAVSFHASRQDISMGDTVTFTDDSTTGGTAWDWTFGAGQGTGSGQTPMHTYNATGTYTVSLTVTYPGPTGPLSHTEAGYIRVNVGMCPVPQLGGVRFNDAQAKWQGFSVQLHRRRDQGARRPERQLHHHGPIDHVRRTSSSPM